MSKHYALADGAPKRMTVSHGLLFRDVAVRVDDAMVGEWSGRAAELKEGKEFALPTGQTLRVTLIERDPPALAPQKYLRLELDGELIPESLPLPTPWWSYLIAVAGIGTVTYLIGGAPWVLLIGAWAIFAESRDATRTSRVRVLRCLGILLLCGMLTFVPAVIFAMFRR